MAYEQILFENIVGKKLIFLVTYGGFYECIAEKLEKHNFLFSFFSSFCVFPGAFPVKNFQSGHK